MPVPTYTAFIDVSSFLFYESSAHAAIKFEVIRWGQRSLAWLGMTAGCGGIVHCHWRDVLFIAFLLITAHAAIKFDVIR